MKLSYLIIYYFISYLQRPDLSKAAATYSFRLYGKMPITILQPAAALSPTKYASDSDDSDDGGADLEGDISMMRPSKRARRSDDAIVTPGEIITTDPQWMRCVDSPLLLSL